VNETERETEREHERERKLGREKKYLCDCVDTLFEAVHDDFLEACD